MKSSQIIIKEKYRICLRTKQVLHDDLNQTEAYETLYQINGGELSSKEVDEEYFVEEYDTDPPKEIKMSDRLGSYPTLADIYNR